MIEDYGTLSEEELIEEIQQELEESSDIDVAELEFKFEDGRLIVIGTLQDGDELESLVGVLENHVEPEDYELVIDLVEGDHGGSNAYDEKMKSSGGGALEESLEDIEGEEIDFVDDEEFEEDDKW